MTPNPKYNPNIHHRHSIRLKGYDYAQAGFYFVTICVQNRECLFGHIHVGSGNMQEMILNDAGQMIKKWYDQLENKFPNIKCHVMVVMPNHFHCIIENVGRARDTLCVTPVGSDLCVGPDEGITDEYYNGVIDKKRNGAIDEQGYNIQMNKGVGGLLDGDGISDERGNDVLGERGNGILDERGNDVLGEHGNDILGECGNDVLGERGNDVLGERGNDVSDERGNEILGERGNDVLGERGNEILGERGNEILAERGNDVLGERGNEILGERGNEISDERGNDVLGEHGNDVLGERGNEILGERGNEILGERGNDVLGEHVGSPLHRVLQWFKTMTTNKYIRGVKLFGWQRFDGKLWQRNYYECIIWDEQSYERISQYILNNPAKWTGDKFHK